MCYNTNEKFSRRKFMKRIIATLIAVMLLFSVFSAINVSADIGYGNIDKKDGVTVSDALLALQASVKMLELDEEQLNLARVNGETEVTVKDALLILQYAVGLLTEFPLKAPTVNETILDNGAYTEDPTADNSFVLDISNLDRNTLYVISSRANGTMTAEDMRLVASLQGLINRSYGMDYKHTTMLMLSNDDSDGFWSRQLRNNGVTAEITTVKQLNDLEDFYNTFKEQLLYCGMTVWDPKVPATANVATTVCGADGYLPAMKGGAVYNKLTELGVEVKLDLCDKFTGVEGTKIADTDIDSSGSKKCDAYLWALEKYMDRCSANYIAYILDGLNVVPGSEFYKADFEDDVSTLNVDYLIARHAFCFDLNPNPDKKEIVCDDPDQPAGTDHDTMIKIMKARYDRANGEIGQVLGFPPWWEKYTTYNPTGGDPRGRLAPNEIEWLYCQYSTSYNLAMEADAASPCAMSNGSMLYKYRSTLTEFKNNNQPAETIEYDSSKTYYTLYVGDYDSSAWMKKYVASYWRDGTNTSIPLLWCFNPNLSQRIPIVWDYVYSHMSANDYISSGEGAGYTMPKNFLRNAETKENRAYEEGMGRWIAYNQKYNDLFNIDITGFIIETGKNSNIPINDVFKAYSQFSPVGAFHNDNAKRLMKYGDTPFVYLFNEITFTDKDNDGNNVNSNAEKVDYTNDNMVRVFKSMKQYDRSMKGFSAYRTICQSPIGIKKLITAYEDYIAETTGESGTYKYVDAYTFFNFVKNHAPVTEIQ